MSLSTFVSFLRAFCTSQLSSTISAQVGSTFPAAEGSCVVFIFPKVSFGAFQDWPISPGLNLLRRWSGLKVRHANIRNGLISGCLEEFSHCCITKPQREDPGKA